MTERKAARVRKAATTETFYALRNHELDRKYEIPREGKRSRWMTLEEIILQLLTVQKSQGSKRATKLLRMIRGKRNWYWRKRWPDSAPKLENVGKTIFELMKDIDGL